MHVALIEVALDNIVFGEALGRRGVEWNVDAAFVEVARNVLPKIRKLQRGAGGVGKTLALLVAVAAKIQNEAADRIRRINTVAEDAIPVGVALSGLILAKRL